MNLASIEDQQNPKTTQDSQPYPTTWDELIKRGIEENIETKNDAKKVKPIDEGEDIVQDPLGLLSTSVALNTIKNFPLVDWRSNTFSASQYLLTFHKSTSINDLMKGHDTLAKKVGDQKSHLKKLVQTHFHRFVGFQSSVYQLHSLIQERTGFTISIINLQHSLAAANKTVNDTFGPLLELKKEMTTHHLNLDLLTHFKFRFMINLPKLMKEDMEKKDYLKVTLHYTRIKQWLHNTDIAMFQQVLYTAQDIISELRSILYVQLEEPNSTRKVQEEAIRLLIALGPEKEEKEDPAWHCLRLRFDYMVSLLELVASQLNAKAKADSDSTKSIKMLSSILQELLPDFWGMSQSFYREEYHTQANLLASSLRTQDDIQRVFDKYPEEKYYVMINQIINLYCTAIRKNFLQIESSLLPSDSSRFNSIVKLRLLKARGGGGGLSLPLSSSSYQSSYQSYMQSSSLDESMSISIAPYDLQDEGELQEYIDYILTLSTIVTLVSDEIKISNYFAMPLIVLFEEITSTFIKSTFTLTIHTAKRLHMIENWEVHDRLRMITSLPIKFMDLILHTLAEFKDLKLRDEALSLCRTCFIECLNIFADVLHHLSREHENEEHRIVMLMNNLSYAHTKVIPDLITHYTKAFNLTWNHVDSVSINRCYTQLQEMFTNLYCRAKLKTLTKLIKHSFLLGGYDWKKKSLNKTGIRDYVYDVLLTIVFIQEELSSLLRDSSGKEYIILLSIQCVYQSYLEWLSEIQDFSLHGLAQLGMEIDFIHTILNQKLTAPPQSPQSPQKESYGSSYEYGPSYSFSSKESLATKEDRWCLNNTYALSYAQYSLHLQATIPNIYLELLNLIDPKRLNESSGNINASTFPPQVKKEMEAFVKHSLDSTNVLFSCLCDQEKI